MSRDLGDIVYRVRDAIGHLLYFLEYMIVGDKDSAYQHLVKARERIDQLIREFNG